MSNRHYSDLSVHDFEFEGSLGSEGASIEKIARNHFRVTLGHAPQHPEWPNKLQFTIKKNARGNTLRLEVEFQEHRRMPFNEYFCSWSYDGRTWHPIQWQKGKADSDIAQTLIFPTFEHERVLVGHQVPMSYEDVQALLAGWEKHPYVRLDPIGQSLEGRSITRCVISKPGRAETTKMAHYFGAQHPGEHNASWRMVGMVDWLLSGEADYFLDDHCCHFVLMTSPDSPSKGWYRVNTQGVDMNRTYLSSGSDREKQAHEAWLCQRDLEQIAADYELMTTWAMHTWQGKVETLLLPGAEMEKKYGSWTKLKQAMTGHDPNQLCKPLAIRNKKDIPTSWGSGPYHQFGVTTFLCEGGGGLYTKSENTSSGKVLLEGFAAYCSGIL